MSIEAYEHWYNFWWKIEGASIWEFNEFYENEIASLNKVNIDAIATPKTKDNNKPDIVAKRQNTDEIIGFIVLNRSE